MVRRALLVCTLLAAACIGAVASGAPGVGAAPTPTSAAFDAPVPSPGCGTSTAVPGREVRHDLTINGAARWFLLTTPPAHDGQTPVPLVLDFHGLAEGALIHTSMSAFSPLAEAEGFAVAFPHGQFDPVRWDINAASNPNNDLAFVDAILDTIGTELCIDTARVYAAGLSFGAFMTSFLTCQRADRFAAVAPVAGLMVPSPCPQARKVPILTFHGTADPILLFNGGVGQLPFLTTSAVPGGGSGGGGAPAADPDLDGPGYPANAAAWAASNGCDPDKTDTPITDEVIHRVWDCPAGADVEFFIILGGGHAWPGSDFSKLIEAVVGYTTFDISATEEAWRFFERFRLPCDPDPTCADPVAPTSSTTSTSSAPSSSSTVSANDVSPDNVSTDGSPTNVSPAAVASPAVVTPRFTG